MKTKEAMRAAVEARQFKTPRVERAIQALAAAFVTVDVCWADANAVAQYIRKLESALSLLRSALEEGEPALLFDGYYVWDEGLTEDAKRRTSPENVADVLDAVVRLMRASPTADKEPV